MVLPAVVALALMQWFTAATSSGEATPVTPHCMALIACFLGYVGFAQLNRKFVFTVEMAWLAACLVVVGASEAALRVPVSRGVEIQAQVGLGALLLVGSTFVNHNAVHAWFDGKPQVNPFHVFCATVLVIELGLVAWTIASTPVQWQDVFGLACGLAFTGVGQVVVIAYHATRHFWGWFARGAHQPKKLKPLSFFWLVVGHFSKPSAFALMGAYLTVTFLLGWMPRSYYDVEARVNWLHVLLQVVAVDMFTVINHIAEHVLPALYVPSHKAHHRFIAPVLFNAFDGTNADTTLLILLPLFCTMRLLPMVHCWSYIAFGVTFSTHLCLIHSEWPHPWEPIGDALAVYSSRDHQAHHKFFNVNYAHFFKTWDRLAGTYRANLD